MILIVLSSNSEKLMNYTFLDPPNKRQATAFLTSSWPYIDGAIIVHIFAYESGRRANSLKLSSCKPRTKVPFTGFILDKMYY